MRTIDTPFGYVQRQYNCPGMTPRFHRVDEPLQVVVDAMRSGDALCCSQCGQVVNVDRVRKAPFTQSLVIVEQGVL